MAVYGGPNVVVDSGLVLSLDAGNTKSYPGSGTIWTDISGQNYIGTLTNSPVFNNDTGGNFSFDGVDDRVSITTGTSVDFGPTTEQFSISIFFKSLASSTRTIPSALYDRYRYYIYYVNSTNTCYMDYVKQEWETSGAFLVNRLTISNLNPKGTWNNICYVYTKSGDNGTLTGYINGNLSGSSTASRISSYSLNSHFIGNSNHSGYGYYSYDGHLAILHVYKIALTSTQVMQNFNALRGRFGL